MKVAHALVRAASRFFSTLFRELPHLYPEDTNLFVTWSLHGAPSLKGATARAANRLLGRTGEPFWRAERIRAHSENNPVAAGLMRTPEECPWSSAGVEKNLDAARTSAASAYAAVTSDFRFRPQITLAMCLSPPGPGQ